MAEIRFTPLSDEGPGLLDAMEGRTGKLPYRVEGDGSRTYTLSEKDAGAIVFDEALDEINAAWRDHLDRVRLARMRIPSNITSRSSPTGP